MRGPTITEKEKKTNIMFHSNKNILLGWRALRL